jgi:hypothetical protein
LNSKFHIMVRLAFLATALACASADDIDEATALLQSGVNKTQGLDDKDTGSCAGKEEFCLDATSMSGTCLRKQPLWDFPAGYWNCERASKFCSHDIWRSDVVRCCPGVCTTEELYRAKAPAFNNGGVGGCEASAEKCTDCGGTSNMCLQLRKGWNPSHTCDNSKKWCTHSKWGKDMLDCCPGVCNTKADEDGECQLTGCSESTGACTKCDDYSDMCLRYLWKSSKFNCEAARDKGYCNHKKFGPDMVTCCPGMCETAIDTENPDPVVKNRCGRVGCQGSEETCTDCNQNSDRCIASRRGKKWTCRKARVKGMCTRNYKKKQGRTWLQDMAECCPKECGAVEIEGVCQYNGCAASAGHCATCSENSDKCMANFKNSYKWTCERARDAGYCSSRRKKRREAMNNCCPGMCKGPHDEADLIPSWAVCRGGSGVDETGIDESDNTGGQQPANPTGVDPTE